MREILFRGKRKDNGEWVEGYLLPHEIVNEAFIVLTGLRIFKDEKTDGKYHVYAFEVIPETVGQYTGLKDKNGKRIFEGDIVKCDDYIFFVKYGKCGGVQNSENYGYMGFYLEAYDEATKRCVNYGLRVDICYFTDIEVIGNIHDNPELLEAK